MLHELRDENLQLPACSSRVGDGSGSRCSCGVSFSAPAVSWGPPPIAGVYKAGCRHSVVRDGRTSPHPARVAATSVLLQRVVRQPWSGPSDRSITALSVRPATWMFDCRRANSYVKCPSIFSWPSFPAWCGHGSEPLPGRRSAALTHHCRPSARGTWPRVRLSGLAGRFFGSRPACCRGRVHGLVGKLGRIRKGP